MFLSEISYKVLQKSQRCWISDALNGREVGEQPSDLSAWPALQNISEVFFL